MTIDQRTIRAGWLTLRSSTAGGIPRVCEVSSDAAVQHFPQVQGARSGMAGAMVAAMRYFP